MEGHYQMTENEEAKGPTNWHYFSKLKSISPVLYRACLALIALGAGLAVFRTVGQGASYEEIAIFVVAGVLFYSLGVLLLFFTKTEVRSVIFSAIALLAFASWYVFQSADTAFFKNLGPSAQSQITWCSIPVFAGFCADEIGNEETPTAPVTTETLETTPSGQNVVYLQFAGSLNRNDDIIPFVTRLCGEEYRWNVQGCEQGGERTAAAAGINLVRFFHEEDRVNAQRLANAILDVGPPRGSGTDLKLQKLDGTRFGSPAVGLLEIWISN